jgi:hypothetical protein
LKPEEMERQEDADINIIKYRLRMLKEDIFGRS